MMPRLANGVSVGEGMVDVRCADLTMLPMQLKYLIRTHTLAKSTQ